MNPYGIRLGTPALTTRGFKERDISTVAEFIHKGNVYEYNYFQTTNIIYNENKYYISSS